jgi:hypothetical protein
MDSSLHNWFGPDLPMVYCIAMIDDASSRLFAAFYDADSTLTNMDLMNRYMKLFGRPLGLYTDHATHFIDNHPEPAETQIQRALRELDIQLTFAHSPQAKGRVERLFETLQDRLVRMMKHRGITTIEAGNVFLLDKFIPSFNKTYARTPLSNFDVHRSAKGFDLDSILSFHDERTITNDYTFQYGGWRHQIAAEDIESRMRRAKVTIEIRTDGTMKARFFDKFLHFYRVERVDR